MTKPEHLASCTTAADRELLWHVLIRMLPQLAQQQRQIYELLELIAWAESAADDAQTRHFLS